MDAIEFGWAFWFVVGGAVTVVAATLLIAILLVTRGIEREAERALDAARRIRENTKPIWLLDTARDVLMRVRDSVEAMEQKAKTLAGTVHDAGGSARREEP